MLEKIKENIATLFGLWVIVTIVYRIFGGSRGFLELVSNGFAFSCLLWVPFKVYTITEEAHRDDLFVWVDEYDHKIEGYYGFRAAGLSVVGIVLLTLFLHSVFGETVGSVILGLLFLARFFVL